MRKTFTLLSLLAAFCANAQTTIILKPHFEKATEQVLFALDSTSAYYSGNPDEGAADEAVAADFPEFSYLAMTNSGCPDFTRHLIRFDQLVDTSILPAGAIILSAKIRLYGIPSSPMENWGNTEYAGSPFEGNDNTGWVNVLAADFTPGVTTWNAQPAYMHTDSVGIPESSAQWNENDTIDVTPLMAELIADGNKGFIFRLQNETPYRERMFASGNYEDSSYHPELVVTYKLTDTTEAVNTITNNCHVVLYPNPAVQNAQMNITLNSEQEVSISVIDMNGKMLIADTRTIKAGTTSYTLAAKQFAAGTYEIEVANKNGILYKTQFVKQ